MDDMARHPDYEFLAPESAVGAAIDGLDSDAYADPADDLFEGLAAADGLYDDGVERHVRDVLGRVFGI
jgi:hypothetical protein